MFVLSVASGLLSRMWLGPAAQEARYVSHKAERPAAAALFPARLQSLDIISFWGTGLL